jgi:probable F420-dependent oxidoreductase
VTIEIGRVGIHSHQAALLPNATVREAITEIDGLGYGAIWIPEGLGFKEAFSISALLLGWTRQMVVATGIANIWARDPMAMQSGGRTLGEAFPERFLLGLGTSHRDDVQARGHSYDGRQLSVMRAYLDAMDAASFRGPLPSEPAPRVLAALGPNMLRLAAERTWGTLSSVVPVEHTAFARDVMGSGPLIAVLQRVILDTDADAARSLAREEIDTYLELDNYRNNLLRIGWSEKHLVDGGSDEIVDALVAWGDVDAIAARVRAHFEAGADHVCIRPLPSRAPSFPISQLRTLAPALRSI